MRFDLNWRAWSGGGVPRNPNHGVRNRRLRSMCCRDNIVIGKLPKSIWIVINKDSQVAGLGGPFSYRELAVVSCILAHVSILLTFPILFKVLES